MEFDKTINKEILVPCLECVVDTYHKVVKSANFVESGDWGTIWGDFEIIICQGCKNISFRKNTGTDDIVAEEPDGTLIYDSDEELFPNRVSGRKKLKNDQYIPLEVKKIYEETYRAVLSHQPILASVGIRALVEAVCSEKKTVGNNLKEKIDNLVTIGFLTKDGAEIIHKTRVYGNEAAHGLVAIKDENLALLMDIAENLLFNTYILPKKVVALTETKN